jgi:hypothetical protein
VKREGYVTLIWLVAITHFWGTPFLGAPSSRASAPQATRESIDGWVRDNYNLALEIAFQDPCTASKDVRWISCVRIVPGHSTEFEYSLSVERRYGGTILGRVIRPKRKSVYVQLCEWKKGHPQATVRELAKFLARESQAGDQHRFPELVRVADEFEKIRLSPALSDEIMMDATQYRFRIRSFSGESMELTLSGPGPTAPHQSNALIKWAESARQMLLSAFNEK